METNYSNTLIQKLEENLAKKRLTNEVPTKGEEKKKKSLSKA